jgi:hypothetical protein
VERLEQLIIEKARNAMILSKHIHEESNGSSNSLGGQCGECLPPAKEELPADQREVPTSWDSTSKSRSPEQTGAEFQFALSIQTLKILTTNPGIKIGSRLGSDWTSLNS